LGLEQNSNIFFMITITNINDELWIDQDFWFRKYVDEDTKDILIIFYTAAEGELIT
jgi:hypothetical protein